MKKLLIILAVAPVALALPFLALAQDASDTIALPTGFVDMIWGQAALLFTSFAPYIATIVGVILAALVIDIVIGALHHRGN
jgi:hypothetical protein